MTNPDDTLTTLAMRRAALVTEKQQLEEAIRDIDDAILARVSVGDHIDVNGQPLWRVQQKRTFDVEIAKRVCPAQLIQAATVPQIDVKALRALMPQALQDQCMKPGAVFVAKAGAKS